MEAMLNECFTHLQNNQNDTLNAKEKLETEAKSANKKSEVIDICSKSYQMCEDTHVDFVLAFRGFQINIHRSKYASDLGRPELVLTGENNVTSYVPYDKTKAMEFLEGRLR